MIIGLTSFLGAGKTSVADYLISKGFVFYSLSDEIREEIKSRGLEITRDRLRETGTDLRKKYGNSVLADRVLEKIMKILKKEPGKNFVVDSIRNPAEIELLRKKKGFTLICLDAPIELRFKRIKSRKREGEEALGFKEFQESEEKELESPDSASQQLLKCKEMADFVINNDSDLKILHKKLDELLEGLK